MFQEKGFIGQDIKVNVEQGRPLRIEKVVAIYSSKDRAISDNLSEAILEIDRADDFNKLCNKHMKIWNGLWVRCHVIAETDQGRIAQILNLHIFHLLQSVSVHSIDLDVGVPPRGLEGEAYRGLIMWDEMFIFPFLNFRFPDLTRSLFIISLSAFAMGTSGLRSRQGTMVQCTHGRAVAMAKK